jgi:hypothetical protein
MAGVGVGTGVGVVDGVGVGSGVGVVIGVGDGKGVGLGVGVGDATGVGAGFGVLLTRLPLTLPHPIAASKTNRRKANAHFPAEFLYISLDSSISAGNKFVGLAYPQTRAACSIKESRKQQQVGLQKEKFRAAA